MDDHTRSRFDAHCPAGGHDDMTKDRCHKRIENDAAAPEPTPENMQLPASTAVETLIVTSEGSWIDIGSGSFVRPCAAISRSDEVASHKECLAEALQRSCDSTSYDDGVQRRRDDIGKDNEIPPTPGKGCSSTECRCETCHKSATATAGDLSQGDCDTRAAERPTRLYKKKALPPNLQSLPESLRRYLGSPMSADPWLPKDLLQDPSVIPNWVIDVAEEEP